MVIREVRFVTRGKEFFHNPGCLVPTLAFPYTELLLNMQNVGKLHTSHTESFISVALYALLPGTYSSKRWCRAFVCIAAEFVHIICKKTYTKDRKTEKHYRRSCFVSYEWENNMKIMLKRRWSVSLCKVISRWLHFVSLQRAVVIVRVSHVKKRSSTCN